MLPVGPGKQADHDVGHGRTFHAGAERAQTMDDPLPSGTRPPYNPPAPHRRVHSFSAVSAVSFEATVKQ
ncbi:hypothetical protein GCM10023107_91170 [Actinoplanes octamycinicus]